MNNNKLVLLPCEGVNGLTVESVTLKDEYAVIRFRGEQPFALVLVATHSYSDSEIEDRTRLSDFELYTQRDLGLISADEYTIRKAEADAKQEQNQLKYQREQYEKLKLKFGGK